MIIREKVALVMESNPILAKLEGKDWYDVEDALVNLISDISGITDKTYEPPAKSSTYPTLLDKKLAETDYSDYEYQIYKKVSSHFQYEDLESILNEEESYMPKEEIEFYKNNADKVIENYDDMLEYDWRMFMRDAMFCVKGDN